MSKFRVKPGDKVTIAIEGDKPVVSGKKPGQPGYIGIQPLEDQLYVFKKETGIKLYDLGMVLNEEGEYAEVKDTLLLSINPSTGEYQQSDQDVENFGTMLQNKYLAGDPTGSTDSKTNRKAIPFDSHRLLIDVRQIDAELNETKTIIGKRERPYLSDIFLDLDATPPIPEENRNWLSTGALKLIAGFTYLWIENAGYFMDFHNYPGLDQFKITIQPNFAADAVAPDLSELQAIYLVPKLNYNTMFYRLGTISVGGFWGAESYQRLSPYEGYEFPLAPYSETLPPATKTKVTNKIVDSGIYARALEGEAERRSLTGASGPDVDGRMRINSTSLGAASFLVDTGADQRTVIRFRAILKTKENLYYVWINNLEPGQEPLNHGWLIVNTGFSHGVVSE